MPSHATDFVSQIVITNIECVKSWWKDKDYLGIRETISNEISISSFPWRWPIVQPYESVNRKLGKPSSFSLGTLSSSVFFFPPWCQRSWFCGQSSATKSSTQDCNSSPTCSCWSLLLLSPSGGGSRLDTEFPLGHSHCPSDRICHLKDKFSGKQNPLLHDSVFINPKLSGGMSEWIASWSARDKL